jgi:hypothetical protein
MHAYNKISICLLENTEPIDLPQVALFILRRFPQKIKICIPFATKNSPSAEAGKNQNRQIRGNKKIIFLPLLSSKFTRKKTNLSKQWF